MKNQVRIIALGALSMTFVFAQGGRGDMGGRRVEMLTRQLSLTDAQQKQATDIFTQAANSTESTRTSMKTVMDAIQAAVKRNDTGTIDQQSITYGTLSAQMMAAERKAEAAFYSILTAEQKTKYDERPPMGGPAGRGFGGPGGPGGDGPRPARGPRPPNQ
ncbi:MAG: Spy/CpxP family protein refolding chaperone [Bryobacteraceae bacterium]|nr:Spy/CpxP family protein refolding chaperone [Bryobacteraceae bacterium]